jgi:hypothetical protein
MPGTLRCLSFHSTKGGVGKSTLATLSAFAAAEKYPECPVFLVDMDLTGTSLADVLPLEAPRWVDAEEVPRKFKRGRPRPSGFWPRDESFDRLEARGAGREIRQTVPMLNDYLLFATPDWSATNDMPIEAVAWKIEGGPAHLRVLPSSALPLDLSRTLPIIFDEEYTAYIEGRLERLLSQVAERYRDAWVIFDVPPTLPGLSRAVASLGLRLGVERKQPLAQDGYIPQPLLEAEVRWKNCLVASLDVQDNLALARWVALVKPEERDHFKVVVNRATEQEVNSGGLWRRPSVRTHASPDEALQVSLDPQDPLLEPGAVLSIKHEEPKRIFIREGLPTSSSLDGMDQLLALVEG